MFGGAIVAGVVAGTFGYPAVFLFGAGSILASAGLVIPAMRLAGRSTAAGDDLLAAEAATGAVNRQARQGNTGSGASVTGDRLVGP